MRTAILAFGVVALIALGAESARAQCGGGGNCSTLPIPALHLDFGLQSAPTKPPRPTVPQPSHAIAATRLPIDCQMVKRVDPKFSSPMPVATPDPNTKLPMRVMAVPACKG